MEQVYVRLTCVLLFFFFLFFMPYYLRPRPSFSLPININSRFSPFPLRTAIVVFSFCREKTDSALSSLVDYVELRLPPLLIGALSS